MTEIEGEPATGGPLRRRWVWGPQLRWFAAEILIVVCGILIALALNAWWAGRESRARAVMFAARLTHDVRLEAWSYEVLIAYYRDVLAGTEVAVSGMSRDSAVSDEAFLIGSYRATQYLNNPPHRATYDELVSTGGIGLIANDTLRQAAVAVFTNPMVERVREEGATSEYRRLFRRIVPVDVQRELVRACGDRLPQPGDYGGIKGMLEYPCTLKLPPERISAAASALRDDPLVLPALQLRYADLGTTVTYLTTNSPMLTNLRRAAGRTPPGE